MGTVATAAIVILAARLVLRTRRHFVGWVIGATIIVWRLRHHRPPIVVGAPALAQSVPPPVGVQRIL